MYCPKCGSGDQPGGNYCTRCGTWLPTPGKRTGLEFGGSSPHETLRMMMIFSLLSAVFALGAGILLYATHLGGRSAIWAALFAAAQLLVIATWQITNFILGLKLRRRMVNKQKDNPAPDTSELTQSREALPASDAERIDLRATSVTEGATELLDRSPAAPRRPEPKSYSKTSL